MESEIVSAPWTAEQVASLNTYQHSGVFHEFTCDGGKPWREQNNCRDLLVAYPDGWRCPTCGNTQEWAFTWMADGSWGMAQKAGA